MYQVHSRRSLTIRSRRGGVQMSNGPEGGKAGGQERGVVYAVENPAMPGYVKIGRTTDLDSRLRSLDNTNVPLPFECFVAMEVDNMREIEGLLHATFADRRTRKTREFFEVPREQVEAAMRLTRGDNVTPENPVAEDAEGVEALKAKRPALTFESLLIPVGAELRFRDIPDYDGEPLTARVVDSTGVEFEGETWPITKLTGEILHRHSGWAKPLYIHHGPYWHYEGERLDHRRDRLNSATGPATPPPTAPPPAPPPA